MKLLSLVLDCRCCLSSASAVSPPQEPAYSYISPDFTVKESGNCLDGSRVWIYKPATEKPRGADVVVYLYGYAAADTLMYQGHIQHLVRQGNYVLFPQYQEAFLQ